MIDRNTVQQRLTLLLANIETGDIKQAQANLRLLDGALREACQPALYPRAGQKTILRVPGIDFYRAAGRAVQSASIKGSSGDWAGAAVAIRAVLTRSSKL